jgi:hypothetical protein
MTKVRQTQRIDEPNGVQAMTCPACLQPLSYKHTIVGGVQPPERWDHFECPRRCGQFEYRHRTRKLKRV